MFDGSSPTSELFAMAIIVRDDKLKMDDGTCPDKLFTFKFSKSSVRIWRKLFGMLPLKLFRVRLRSSREERFPNEEGIVPDNLLPPK
uniref:Uncharacterized protein n=1 Tax=Oryza brachyantha TaxID=4533 RepID=J3MFD0_ORYBR